MFPLLALLQNSGLKVDFVKLAKLHSLADVKASELTGEHVATLASVVGITIPENSLIAKEIVEAIASSDVDRLADVLGRDDVLSLIFQKLTKKEDLCPVN